MNFPRNVITERLKLKGVSDITVGWYNCSFKAFKGALESKQDIIVRIAAMKNRSVSHITINSYLRCINAYFRWLHTEHNQPLLKIPKLKEEQKILAIFTQEHIAKILRYRAKGVNAVRAWHACMVMLDSGLRISEVLGLTGKNVDFENLVIKVKGKGGEERLVPMSLKLRKNLYRYAKDKKGLLFVTRTKTSVLVQNFQRDFRVLCGAIGIKAVRYRIQMLRHFFAVNYLSAGGILEYLRRMLGHSSLTTTQKYLRALGVEDLRNVHDGLSLLTKSNA